MDMSMYKNCSIREVRNNYYQVIGDSNRFGKNAILFEGINKKECEDFCKKNKCDMCKTFRYRSISAVRKRIDKLLKEFGEVIIDCGVVNYKFHHYEVCPVGSVAGKCVDECLDIYVEDFDSNKSVILLLSLDNDNLRKANKKMDLYRTFIHASWESKYPTLLNMYAYKCL